MTFRVGQGVVCVDDKRSGDYWVKGTQVYSGRIYTVRDIGLTNGGRPGLRLAELQLSGECGHITRLPFRDAYYRADRFRPLVSRQTDISALQALLVPGAKIREEA